MVDEPDADPRDGRNETQAERLDRNWNALLQELRVLQTGTQLLTGFLLTVAFQPAFHRLAPWQVVLYLVVVSFAVISTVVVLMPVALHRALFRHRAMSELVDWGDRMLRIGSCNVNNRSTGFDTECDVALEAQDGEAGAGVRAAVRTWRTRMVAHWLAKPPAAVDAALARGEGLAAAIARLDDPAHRRLRPLEPAPIGPIATFIATYHIGDPAGPSDSWRPWNRRVALERNLARASHRLEAAGLPAPVDELSPETV